MKALAKDPQKRYTSITEFATALEEASKQIPPGSRVQHDASTPQHTAKRSSPLIVPLLVTLLLFVFGFIGGIFTSIFHPATVSIIPTSVRFVQSYHISAVVGHPDPSLHQVDARFISSTASPQSEMVHTTGIGRTAGVRAQGELTFYNGLNITQSVPARTLLTTANGIQVVTDVDALIPPANPPYLGSVTVPSHALNVGKAGNIEANNINQICCSSDNSITVKNLSPFNGGQDPQIYSFVRQSDIDGAANTLEVSSKPKALTLLQEQVRPNEMLLATIQCSRNEISDPRPDEMATTVNVTITVTCKSEVFDNAAATSITINLLKADLNKCLEGTYVLKGHILTSVLEATLADAKQGTIALLIRVEGFWIFQFSNAQKQKLVRLIAGKNRKDAHDLLLEQTGVSNVDIQTPWWVPWIMRDTLPTNTNSITLVTIRAPTSSPPTRVCVSFCCGICNRSLQIPQQKTFCEPP